MFEQAAATTTSDAQCRNLTVCGADEYEYIKPTLSSNRECDLLMVCDDSEYEKIAPIAGPQFFVTNRVCKSITQCDYNRQYLIQPATTTSDVVCEDITVCRIQNGTYQAVRATMTSDAQCEDIRECLPDEREVVPPTDTSNRVCEMEGIVRSQVRIINRTVEDFRDNPDIRSAFSKRIAVVASRSLPGLVITEADVEILNLRAGSVVIMYSVAVPSSAAQSVFESLQNFDAILAELMRSPDFDGIGVSDVVCDQSKEYEVNLPIGFGLKGCELLTLCNTTSSTSTMYDNTTGREYEASAPTLTTDRVCAQLTSCNSSEFQATAPTPTTNRICQQLRFACLLSPTMK